MKTETKTKILLSAAYIVSLTPMLLPQYGGRRGVQEISGLINLLNPIGLISAALFFCGLWLPFRNRSAAKAAGLIGCAGMVISEIYRFLTWHILTVTGKFSINSSLRLAYPEFYIGTAASLIMVVVYICLAFSKKERAAGSEN